jgi:hypothetical protein
MKAHEEPLLIRPAIFSSVSGVVALQTTRKGGFSQAPFDSLNLGLRTADDSELVRKNLRHLCDHLGLPAESVVLTDQVHGNDICIVDRPGNVTGFDALITDTPGIYPGIVTADCYPVLIHDPEHHASGAVHAGWQGTAGSIAKKTVAAMGASFGTRPEACIAWVGTGISATNYEIGEEVADRFEQRYLNPSPGGKGRFLLDLSTANRDQLIAAGIPERQVDVSTWCSSRDRELFFSYRRDHGMTGRMLSIIGVMPSCSAP